MPNSALPAAILVYVEHPKIFSAAHICTASNSFTVFCFLPDLVPRIVLHRGWGLS